MWSIKILILIKFFVLSLCNEEMNCYFKVEYSNGSRSWCLDEECSNHIDIISLQSHQCRTNYLSLKFSSYSTYSYFLSLTLDRKRLSEDFSMGRPNVERLLQIEFLSPLENDRIFRLDHLSLLSRSISNIDTYELIFNGNISTDNRILYVDKQMLMSKEQIHIDTLRLRFNCTDSLRVEWELIQSIQSFPESPCKQQIQFLNKTFKETKEFCFSLTILISFIGFVSLILLIIIGLFLFNYHNDYRLKQNSISISQTELMSISQRF